MLRQPRHITLTLETATYFYYLMSVKNYSRSYYKQQIINPVTDFNSSNNLINKLKYKLELREVSYISKLDFEERESFKGS